MPACIVVMMSAYHMVDRAVEAMKLGAYDYLIKPFHLTDLDHDAETSFGDAVIAGSSARHG